MLLYLLRVASYTISCCNTLLCNTLLTPFCYKTVSFPFFIFLSSSLQSRSLSPKANLTLILNHPLAIEIDGASNQSTQMIGSEEIREWEESIAKEYKKSIESPNFL